VKIRVGSRDSKLAVIQSNIVIDAIKKKCKDTTIELITMKTTGDLILDRTLDKIGGKGLFVKELDNALIDNEVDITVHSFKDMPMNIDEIIPIIAVSKREDPRDVLILPKGVNELDLSKPIGSSSLRRKLQIEKLIAGAKVGPIRGNLQTRLKKLDNGEFSALVLACAGVKRLGLEDRIHRFFEVTEILPSACQGVLVVQSRSDFKSEVLNDFNDETSFICSRAERSFVRTLNGGCSAPFCAYATIDDNTIKLTGMYVDKNNNIYKSSISGEKENADYIGGKLAKIMRSEYENE